MRIHCLSDSWPWFGKHQCYTALTGHLMSEGQPVDITRTDYSLRARLLGRIYSLTRGEPRSDSIFHESEVRFRRKFKSGETGGSVYHVLFYDVHYPMFARKAALPPRVLVTIHHPVGRSMDRNMKKNLVNVPAAVVLCREAVDYFRPLIGGDKVWFIHHGVDTDFFAPLRGDKHTERFVLFTGQNGRNLSMLVRVAKYMRERLPDLKLKMLVPPGSRNKEESRELQMMPNVDFLGYQSEGDLLKLYREAYLLLLPMRDSGVNNAVLESMACGLPVVTTDVGGIRDYGGGSVYPVVRNDDDEAMLDLMEKYIRHPRLREQVAKDSRRFAEDNLDWKKVARRHIEVYRELAG